MTPPPPPAPSSRPAGRSCGPCDLCCKLPSIDWPEYPELEKPADEFCKHCIPATGCAIHADRPMHCASFQCLWLMGFGAEELKPDRIGGFFDAIDEGTLFLIADRERPDPRTLPAVARFIADWKARRKAKLVMYRDGKEIHERPDRSSGPPGRRERR